MSESQKLSITEQLQHKRTEIELRKAEIQLRSLNRLKTLMEARDPWDNFDYRTGTLHSLADRFSEGNGELFYQFSLPSDRRHGDNWPFWRTWMEHANLRAQANLVCTITSAGQGILEGLTSFVVGPGFVYTAKPKEEGHKELAKEIDSIFDTFHEANLWSELEQELFKRSRRDGEYFLRYFDDDEVTRLRVIEPAEVVELTGNRAEHSYGIRNDPEDIETVLGYHVTYTGDAIDAEEIDAEEIDHVKVNVDRRVKRGCTDFCWQVEELIKSSGRGLENMSEATAIQSAIAFIRQHETGDSEAVQDFVNNLADYTKPTPFGGADRNTETFYSGKIVDIPKGMTYTPSPFATSVPNFTASIQSVLQAVAVRWNAPPWLASGSMESTSFASSLTAENPFVKTCERAQSFYGSRWKRTHWKVLKAAVDARGGYLVAGGRSYSWRDIRKLIEIDCEPPRIPVRNRGEEAQVDSAYVSIGAKSRQQVAAEQGYDWESVKKENKEYEEEFGQAGMPLDMEGLGMGGEADEPLSDNDPEFPDEEVA